MNDDRWILELLKLQESSPNVCLSFRLSTPGFHTYLRASDPFPCKSFLLSLPRRTITISPQVLTELLLRPLCPLSVQRPTTPLTQKPPTTSRILSLHTTT